MSGNGFFSGAGGFFGNRVVVVVAVFGGMVEGDMEFGCAFCGIAGTTNTEVVASVSLSAFRERCLRDWLTNLNGSIGYGVSRALRQLRFKSGGVETHH